MPINFYLGVIILHQQWVTKKATMPLSSQPYLVLNARIFFKGGKPAAALI
jgi:hypothetical protein